MNTQVLVIGGGLSGVTVAHLLAKRGIDSLLIEAKDILGGRILSLSTDAGSSSGINPAIDLGPSWFWPDQQRMAALINDVNLSSAVFEQASDGKSVIEYGNGSTEHTLGGASMAGSLRISGGMVHLVNQIAATLPSDSVLHNTAAQSITSTEQGVLTVATNGERTLEINSSQVVLALPPRVVAQSIAIQPVMASGYCEKLESVSTWMAAESKLVLSYSQPFWKNRGLSGDGMSQMGPMVEIHDASPKHGGPYALFGFVGIASDQRKDNEAQIKKLAIEQITRMFGAEGANPLNIYFKDWAFDSFTTTDSDRLSHRAHPSSRGINRAEWGGKLIWAGSEMAGSSCAYAGYLEGAVESAYQAVALLKQ